MTSARVVLVGDGGSIFLTTDGQHWQQRPSGTQATLLDVAFADARNGWAVGSEGTILHTADGGLTWAAQTSGLEGTERSLCEVTCQGASAVWIVGAGARLRTTDRGEHWLRVTGEERRRTGLPTFPGLTFADDQVGWAVFDQTVSISRDGGSHWRLQWEGPRTRAALYVGKSVCADTEHVWLAADRLAEPLPGELEGGVLATADGGRTWRWQLRLKTPVRDLYCTDADHVWALTSDSLYRSVDGGVHWGRVRDAGGSALAFSDARRGWCVSEGADDCTVWGTEDGGLTWRRQATVKEGAMLYVGGMVACGE